MKKPYIYEDRLLGFTVALATPRNLPSALRLPGRVVILDLAFSNTKSKSAGSHRSVTHKLISNLGPRLVTFLDHHDSVFHKDFADDDRFYLATKAEHGACPEMITPEIQRGQRL